MIPPKDVPLEYQILPQPLTPADEKELATLEANFAAKVNQSLHLRKMTVRRKIDARALLESGEDPFLVAVHMKVPFSEVAKIANNILKTRGFKQRIPEDVPSYLKLAAYLEFTNRQAAKHAAKPTE